MTKQNEPRDGRRYGGLLLHERRADRHARLVATGLDFFGTVGFGGTTIPMLCSAAGVTARHFYAEFSSREALLKEIYDDIAQHVLDRVRSALGDRALDAHERIRRSNEAYFAYLMDDPRRARIYALESMGVSAELEAHRRAVREAFIAMIGPDQRHVLAPLDSRLLSVAVAGAAHALLLDWVMAERGPAIENMVDTIAAIWTRTLDLAGAPARKL